MIPSSRLGVQGGDLDHGQLLQLRAKNSGVRSHVTDELAIIPFSTSGEYYSLWRAF
jgi:hypothetical protein